MNFMMNLDVNYYNITKSVRRCNVGRKGTLPFVQDTKTYS